MNTLAGEVATFDPSSLLTGGILTPVAIVVLIMTKWLSPKWMVTRLEAQVDRLTAELEEARRSMTDEVVPALTRSVDALNRASIEAEIRRRS